VTSFPAGVAYDSAELSYFMNRPGAETIVLEAEGAIAAFLIMEVHRNRRFATIVTLDVKNGHRRRGYATKLLERSEQILVGYGIEIYDLQVDVANSAAIRFYRRHGFEAVRRLKAYYANGNDAWLMMKQL
jgi:ribosomal-protein-alanine N-acetyltransferase